MSEVKIEIAKVEDVSAIAEIAYQTGKKHEEVMPDYFKPSNAEGQTDYLKEAIESQDSEVFKAVADGKIVGYLVLYVWDQDEKYFVYPEIGYIGSVGVDEKYRRQGIGAQLMHFAENWCKSHNIGEIELDVFAFNEDAARFYERLGYDVLKIKRNKVLK